jgi:flagellar hook-length control protein FliK
LQDSQTANVAASPPAQQPSTAAPTAKKNVKDVRQKSESPAAPVKKQTQGLKNDKSPTKSDSKPQTSGGQGQQRQAPKPQEEPQLDPAVAQEAVIVPEPPHAPPEAAPAGAGQPQTPKTQKRVVKAIASADAANAGTATPANNNQPPDSSQSAATSTDSQTQQNQQLPQKEQGGASDVAPVPSPSADSLAIPAPAAKANKPGKQASANSSPVQDSPAPANATDGAAVSQSATDATPPAPKAAPDDILAKIGMPNSLVQFHAEATDPQTNEAAPAKAPALPPEAQFAELNHPKLIETIHGHLLPQGGTMTLRLDPPELGAMNVRVEVRDGVINASFEASNDQTAKLLSHSLGDLKTALEAQGVSVEKLHVSQTPPNHSSSQNPGRRDSDRSTQDRSAQQEQQRREMMRRMWRRLMNAQDPLDLVA